MAQVIDGKALAKKIRENLKVECNELKEKGIVPKLAVIMVGDNPASKDVDGFTPSSVGKLCIGEDTFISCTPYGVMKMFEEYNIDLTGKDVVILGRSNIVGKPLIQCCLQKNATVTVCHSKTKNLEEHTRRADIIIAAIGQAKFVKENMVKDGAVVIDVGINRGEDGKLYGDVDFENVEKKASYITPVPGGVGPMTIAMLMNNVIKATKQQYK